MKGVPLSRTMRGLLSAALGACVGCHVVFGAEPGIEPADAALPCPPMYTSSRSGSYWVGTEPKAWLDAQQTCARHSTPATRSTHLAVLEDSEALSDVADLMQGEAFWIGYTDLTIEGEFRWVTGQALGFPQPGSPVWAFGQPDNFHAVEDCVSGGVGGPQLHDAECADTRAFVCECDDHPSIEANFGL